MLFSMQPEQERSFMLWNRGREAGGGGAGVRSGGVACCLQGWGVHSGAARRGVACILGVWRPEMEPYWDLAARGAPPPAPRPSYASEQAQSALRRSWNSPIYIWTFPGSRDFSSLSYQSSTPSSGSELAKCLIDNNHSQSII